MCRSYWPELWIRASRFELFRVIALGRPRVFPWHLLSVRYVAAHSSIRFTSVATVEADQPRSWAMSRLETPDSSSRASGVA
jgi:hypothetical protein